LEVSAGARQVLQRKGTEVIDAYDYVLRGMKETQANTMEGSARARYCFESALELDPDYAAAHARLALNYIFRWIQDWSDSKEDSLDKGLEFARKAVAIDNQLAMAHAAMCWAHLWQGEHNEAIAEGRLAIDLDPDDVLALERLAMSMIFSGDPDSSLALIEKARRLNPNFTYDFVHGLAMFMMSNYSKAIEDTQRSFDLSPNFVPAGLYLAASHALAGNQNEAEAAVAKIRQANPSYQITDGFLTQFKNSEDRERFTGGLRQAGIT
jgi:adenylate cyclase